MVLMRKNLNKDIKVERQGEQQGLTTPPPCSATPNISNVEDSCLEALR